MTPATPSISETEWVAGRLKAHAPVRKPGTMNKLEARYAAHLRALVAAGDVVAFWFEAVTFKLGPDCRFTPDFKVQMRDGSIEFHECKGFRRDDAMAKIRIAAGQHPERFMLVEGNKGAWKFTEIKA